MEYCLAILSDTVWYTPTLFVMIAFIALLWEVIRHRSHVPVYEAAPRPPGESLRNNLDGLNEKLVLRFLLTVGFAIGTGVLAMAIGQRNNLPLVNAVLFSGAGIALALTLWTWRLIVRWRQSHLGFEGERLVGRQLNLLMLDGCRVFHDLTDKQIGNIDHIIVAPHAVFVVETATVRKAPPPGDARGREVLFTGRELRFPTFTTDRPLRQAAGNARWLRKYLTRATGVQLPVHPILTLPGWHVQRKGSGPVNVVNPKEIASIVVDKAAAPLYEAQRQQVINLLDAKCQYGPI